MLSLLISHNECSYKRLQIIETDLLIGKKWILMQTSTSLAYTVWPLNVLAMDGQLQTSIQSAFNLGSLLAGVVLTTIVCALSLVRFMENHKYVSVDLNRRNVRTFDQYKMDYVGDLFYHRLVLPTFFNDTKVMRSKILMLQVLPFIF